jgi:diguanylate cyclase (GGDEF)-like protein
MRNVSCRVSAGIGVSYFPDHGETLNHLMLAADKAMYAAKLDGKNAYTMDT